MLRHPSRKLGQWKKIPHLSVEHTVNLKVNLPHPKPVVNLQMESQARGNKDILGCRKQILLQKVRRTIGGTKANGTDGEVGMAGHGADVMKMSLQRKKSQTL